MEVVDWLRTLGLEQYAPQFCDNHITADLLPNLTADDLRDLGVASVGHRRRLLDAIALFRDKPGAGTHTNTEQPSGEPHENAPGERRQVTVLFADLTGYTQLSRLLDAEEIEGILTAFFEIADAAIVEHGGTIDKHIGDCVMAVFGAPIAHGNDAERAVLAALKIRDAIPMLRERLGRDIGVHVGVASGEVLASQIGSARHKAYTVTGESVNLASRLTDHAHSGEVLLSSAVHHALRDRFDCVDFGEVHVKGFAVPERAWRLSATRNAPPEGRTFVGRAAELGQFAALMANCLAVRRGGTVYLRGEAGLGKTRLAEEFQRRAQINGFSCHGGLVLDFGAGSGRDAVVTIVRSIAFEEDAEPSASDVATDPIGALVEAGDIAADRAVFLYELLNMPAPMSLRALYDAMDIVTRNRGVLATITEVVASAAKDKPLLIMIEDLHWADDAVLARIVAVAAATSDFPVLLVLTSRNVGDPFARGWQPGSPTLTIDLAPLHHEEAVALARDVFGQIGPRAMSCLERAAGNPLFLEQLLRNAEEHADSAVPDSVQSLVQSRMDRLAPTEKKALQAASVFGQRFSLGELRALIEDRLMRRACSWSMRCCDRMATSIYSAMR